MNPIFIKYTWKSLKENRTRTWVTVVGILLSAALVTAVTVSLASFLYYMRNVAVERTGDWCVDLFEAEKQDIEKLSQDRRVDGWVTMENVGFSVIVDDSEIKPYLFVGAVGGNFTDRMPVTLTEGRMPQNSTELLIPVNLASDGGVELTLGQSLTLTMGYREADGRRLGRHDGFLGEGYEVQETFVPDGRTVTYTVVGFYEKAVFEDRWSASYLALTAQNASGETESPTDAKSAAGLKDNSTERNTEKNTEVWIRLHNLRDAESFLREKQKEGLTGEVNSLLLKYTGHTENDLIELLYALVIILMIMVVVGSVALIYNAFSISVTERTKQFGLLRSLGATKRQLMQSVLWEGLMLCAAGIPLGILTGCVGIFGTLWCCRSLLDLALGEFSTSVQLRVHVTAWSVGAAAALDILTVLLSAWLPARKALRIPPMEAIRQNDEVKIRPGRVRTSPLTVRLFGLEGMLASKNFKRSRKRYRATIFSLFFSIVLFICANSFCYYMTKSVEDSLGAEGYDLSCYMSQIDQETAENLYVQLSGQDGIQESIMTNRLYLSAAVDREDMTQLYREYHDQAGNGQWDPFSVIFVEEAAYERYLQENGLDPAVYMDKDYPTALVYDRVRVYEPDTESLTVYYMLKSGAKQLTIQISQENEEAHNETVQIGQILETEPWFASEDRAQIFLPAGLLGVWDLGGRDTARWSFFKTQDYNRIYEVMNPVCSEAGAVLINDASTVVSTRAMLALVEVFAAGFLVLISLITAANVFNTISTNIQLRRREFAVLESIGMTQKGLQKTLNYECLLYGIKSLVLALPVAIYLTWIIYDLVAGGGYFVRFYIPWQIMLIAVAAVFAVVFATMVYSMQKLKSGELAEAIRMENA